MNRTINVMLRSDNWGQGKSVTALSYTRLNKEAMRRLVVDSEYRDMSYQSQDGRDHPANLQFAFDFFPDVYEGGLTAATLVKLYTDIASDKFGYDVLIFDNVALFQDDLYVLLSDKPVALQVAKGMRGVYERQRIFLDYKFNPSNPPEFYSFLKTVLKALLLACRQHGVDVITTTESKNVWKNYGSRSREEEQKPKILGQTAKALDPWFQFCDVLLVLSRIKGKREDGTAKLTPWPTARLDTFNTKCSLPGLAPEFAFKDWDVFWGMIEKRAIPTEQDFAQVEIEQAQEGEDEPAGPVSIEAAKAAIVELAIKHGIMKSPKDKDGGAVLVKLGAEHGLDNDNALAQYSDWVRVIEETHPLTSDNDA